MLLMSVGVLPPVQRFERSAEAEEWRRDYDGWLVASPVERPFRGRFWLMIGWTYRAFLVAMGSTQIPKNSFDGIFPPVVCVESLHSLLASAALEG